MRRRGVKKCCGRACAQIFGVVRGDWPQIGSATVALLCCVASPSIRIGCDVNSHFSMTWAMQFSNPEIFWILKRKEWLTNSECSDDILLISSILSLFDKSTTGCLFLARATTEMPTKITRKHAVKVGRVSFSSFFFPGMPSYFPMKKVK